jgi:outer membrane protein OmpA-like peptidoglycan-associated protein
MKAALSRLALALGLFALAPLCAADSYVVLLKNPFDVENHVHIVNSQGTFGISNPGYGAPIGQSIQTVRRYEPEQINADFSHALEGMSAILAAGLPPLSHSYAALLELPQGPLGKIAFYSEGSGDIVLDQAGQAALIDGYSDDPFQVDSQQIRRDFAPALASLDEIIQAGFRPLSYIVLLEDPDGNVGKVIVNDERGRVLIEESGQAVDMGAHLLDSQVFTVGEDAVRQDFGGALDSKPVLPAKYVLLFQIGSTKLIAESETEIGKLLEDVKSRTAPDITIDGHTDTVGRDTLNDKLSKQRAESIAELIRTQGAELRAIDIEYYGKRKPLVKTPDNTPELRNRRVEVTVR